MQNKTFSVDQNVTINCIATATPTLCEYAVTPWLHYIINVVTMLATCQSQGLKAYAALSAILLIYGTIVYEENLMLN